MQSDSNQKKTFKKANSNNNYLVIFDIDGTLTQTTNLDSKSYFKAFSNYLDLEKVNKNWQTYRYSTDSGLVLELFEKHMNRLPSNSELQTIKERFFQILESTVTQDRSHCLPLPGANTLFRKIDSMNNWDQAIATGCWSESALIKLKYADLPYQQIPLACGDDHIERHEIIRIAIDRAKKHYHKELYKAVIYVGDRLWDYKASQQLGIQFIGVGEALIQKQLPGIPIVKDYLTNHFIKHLNDLTLDMHVKEK